MSQFLQSSSTEGDDDWVTDTLPPSEINMQWMKALFPNKTEEKCEKWLQILLDNEFENEDDLKSLSSEDWKTLSLPLGVESAIRKKISEAQTVLIASEEGEGVKETVETIGSASQIDMIVVDISASMRARSTLDEDKTREDVSKMLFHTMIDKLMCLELHHAVGLLAFGQSLHPYTITDEYEQFHDFLGRLDANEGGTMLYDAIYEAAGTIEAFADQYPLHINNNDGTGQQRKKRIFVLTDGKDNRSHRKPWEVAQHLQLKGIQLDAIPLASFNPVLQSICTASGGLCFRARSQEQAITLFEREATLHTSYRDEVPSSIPITDPLSLKSLEDAVNKDGSSSTSVTEMKSAVPPSVKQAVMKKEDIGSLKCSGASMKRILKEYNSFQESPVHGWEVYINANDMSSWKAVLNGCDMPAPYTGGQWLLTIDFPREYPFRPPRIKFITPVYHCNISSDGNICLDILKDTWNPAMTVSRALVAISFLLQNPNPDDPLDAYKGQLYRDNKDGYVTEAIAHTQKNAVIDDEILAKLLSANES
jgi:ubiquitin-protein ligase